MSSLDMVTTTDPTERMQMLSEAVNQSGKSFDEMSYYQRKALAEAMGLSDVSELALMMRDGFDAAVPAQQQSQEELAAQAKAAADYQSIADELTQTVRQFAVSMRPLIKAFKWTLQLIQDINGWFGGYLIPTVILAVSAWVSLNKAALMTNTILNTFRTGIFKTIAAKIKDAWATATQTAAQRAKTAALKDGNDEMKKQEKQMGKSGKAAGMSAVQMMAFGVALMFVGAGVFLAAAGVALIALAFSQLNVAQIIGATVAIIAFGYGIVTVIASLAALVTGPQAAISYAVVGLIVAIGFAALMAGAGIALIAFGMSLLVDSFARLLDTATPEKMLGFTIALAGFVGTLFLMVPLLNFLPLIALGLVAVGFAMWLLSEYVNTLDLTGVEVLGTFFGGIAGLIAVTQENIYGVAEGISKIVSEVNKLDAEKAITLSAAMDSVTAVTKAVSGEEGTSGPGATARGGQKIEIILKLKEKTLAKTTVKIVNGMFASDTDVSFA